MFDFRHVPVLNSVFMSFKLFHKSGSFLDLKTLFCGNMMLPFHFVRVSLTENTHYFN